MSGLRLTLGALASHWRRRPLQLAATIAGLTLATALWSGVQALNDQARRSYDQAATLLGGAETPRIVRRDGAALTTEDYVTLRRAGWSVSPALQGRVRIGAARYQIIGVEPITAPAEAVAAAAVADALASDDGQAFVDFLTPPYRAFAGPATAAELGPAPRLATGPALPPVVAVDGLAEGVIVVDIGVAQKLLDAPGKITQLVVGPAQTSPRADLGLIGDGAFKLLEPAPDSELGRLTDSFHLNLTAFGFLAFVVGLFIVHAAVGLAFEQRRATFRTLRALGVSATRVGGARVLELVALAIVAGLFGVALGYAIAAALLPGVAASLRGLYGARVAGELTLSWEWWALGILVSLVGAAIASAGGVWRATRAPVLASVQPEAWAAAEAARRRLQLLGAGLLFAAALGFYASDGGLLAAFGVMAGLLLGAALALPSARAVLIGLARRVARALGAGPLWDWFWADARQQLSGLSLALMALLLALSASVGVGAMVESFRTTFTGWIDKRLAAEVYVSPADPSRSPEIRAWLDARENVSATLPMVWVDSAHGGRTIDLLGLADHATFRESWPLIGVAERDPAAAWDAVAGGAAAMASEQFLRRQGLALGATVALETPTGRWPVRIVASYPDYGNPEGQLVVAGDALKRAFPEAETRSLGVRIAPESAPSLVAALRDRLALDDAEVMDQAAVKALSTRIFNATFVVTDALSVLTLGVAGVALFASLLTLSDMRLGQLAPVWASGAPRGRLEALELLKACALAFLTALAAIPLGVATAWVLVALVNVAAFGWRLPLYHFPGQWLTLALGATLIGLLAALPAAARLRRARPIDLIRVFSEER